jgi:DUF4097 and DUF4098 domain-containing protein YvlB
MLKKVFLLFLIYSLPVQYILADGIIKEQTLPTSQGKTLKVKVESGDVTISTWSKDEAYIKISGNDEAKDKLTYKIDGKDGDIFVAASKSQDISNANNISLKIEISIPEKFNTEIATAGGDISLGGLTGSVKLKTAGGDITLRNINGDANLKTAGGDIKIESFSGNLSAKTAGGNINITSSEGSISAKTSGGDVIVGYSGVNKGIDLSTSGGNINLSLPENISAKVELVSMNGEIKSDFTITGDVSKTARQKITGEIGSGGELIKCKTMGGNITIEKIK